MTSKRSLGWRESTCSLSEYECNFRS